MPRPLVLVICTGNACRSQMAAAFLQAAAGGQVEVVSAGTHPAGSVHPMVIEVMAERGFDLGGARSEHVETYREREIAILVTVCERAERACPAIAGVGKRYHWPFKDPITVVGTDEMIRKAFRRSRNELEAVFTAYGLGLADGRDLGADPSV